MTTRPGLASSVHLDLVRGLAAVVVLVAHVRVLFLVDLPAVERPNPATTLLYFYAGFFHQAVLAFFVLSGFFIASSAAQQVRAWSWRRYAVDRGVRLYVVLVPALAVTAACDALGLAAAADVRPYYATVYMTDGEYRSADVRGPDVLLANLAFLQTVVAPPYGSNTPLWSLANEFWYYAVFPLLLLAAVPGRGPARRAAFGLLGVGLLVLLPPVRPLFPVWLLGAAVRGLPPVAALRSRGALWAASVAAAAVAVGVRVGEPSPWTDYGVGLAFAAWLYVLLHQTGEARPGAYRAVARGLAGCSFTLYAVHMPLLVVALAFFGSDKSQPTAEGLVKPLAVGVGVFTVAWLLARVTERRTDRVRDWVNQRLAKATRHS